jgi:hypothetical protein
MKFEDEISDLFETKQSFEDNLRINDKEDKILKAEEKHEEKLLDQLDNKLVRKYIISGFKEK